MNARITDKSFKRWKIFNCSSKTFFKNLISAYVQISSQKDIFNYWVQKKSNI